MSGTGGGAWRNRVTPNYLLYKVFFKVRGRRQKSELDCDRSDNCGFEILVMI